MTEEQKDSEKEILFGVIAEKEGVENNLFMMNLSFERLFDDVVIPYQQEESFFIDGVPIDQKKLRKIKILRQTPACKFFISDFHRRMRTGDLKTQQLYATQYNVRLEAIFRESAEDVTSQIIKAYNTEVKPKLRDYLPNRQEILGAAFTAFIAAIKSLGGS